MPRVGCSRVGLLQLWGAQTSILAKFVAKEARGAEQSSRRCSPARTHSAVAVAAARLGGIMPRLSAAHTPHVLCLGVMCAIVVAVGAAGAGVAARTPASQPHTPAPRTHGRYTDAAVGFDGVVRSRSGASGVGGGGGGGTGEEAAAPRAMAGGTAEGAAFNTRQPLSWFAVPTMALSSAALSTGGGATGVHGHDSIDTWCPAALAALPRTMDVDACTMPTRGGWYNVTAPRPRDRARATQAGATDSVVFYMYAGSSDSIGNHQARGGASGAGFKCWCVWDRVCVGPCMCATVCGRVTVTVTVCDRV